MGAVTGLGKGRFGADEGVMAATIVMTAASGSKNNVTRVITLGEYDGDVENACMSTKSSFTVK